ncbi:MAG TPA: CehA/McbA family metallohydrolase [Chryseosolibacter sp.]
MNKASTLLLLFCVTALPSTGQIKIDPGFYHLRNTGPREWAEFPGEAFAHELSLTFEVRSEEIPKTLSLRQYDVKLNWTIELNGQYLGTLHADEKDLMQYHIVDRSAVTIGTNNLRIYSKESVPDDIRAGEIQLYQEELSAILMQASIDLEIVDENNKRIPGHVTVINEHRVLQSFATNKGQYATRPGNVYSATGAMKLYLPPGIYTIFADRGFEFGVDSVLVELQEGDSLQKKLTVKREVNTEGWVACDTHVHTETYSGHGDASARERVITLAAQGVELPILTDHNQHINLNSVAKRAQVDGHMTLVTGNEVTSRVGHFNVFPIDSTESVISSTAPSWTALRSTIEKYRRPKVVILNHARDVHNNFRPHDPSRFLAIAGQRIDGEPLFANAMEIVNSGSQQSDWMQLVSDWMQLLNGGHDLTPVGSSDSHDVSRFIVGQGRTYIRANDSSPDSINIHEVVDHFLAGKVMVSCGLLSALKVNGTFGPGEMATASEDVIADIEVSGPSWSRADKISLYVNGEKFKEEKINDTGAAGVKWKGRWSLPKWPHDYHVVAVAEGPGHNMIFWPLAKPYQPTSTDWTPRVIGVSGAVWVDADANSERESAHEYANRIILRASNNIGEIVKLLQGYDESVAIQVAAILHLNNVDLTSKKIQNALKKASEKTITGFDKVIAALKLSNIQKNDE